MLAIKLQKLMLEQESARSLYWLVAYYWRQKNVVILSEELYSKFGPALTSWSEFIGTSKADMEIFSSIQKSLDTSSSFFRLSMRWLSLLAILAIELIGTTSVFEASLVENNDSWLVWLFANSKEIWHIGIWSAGAIFFTLAPQLHSILNQLRVQSSGYHWSVWLIRHAIVLTAFLLITSLIFGKPTDPTRLTSAAFAGWFMLASATFLSWLLALAPFRFWLRLLRQERLALLMGIALGINIWIVVGMLVRQEAPLAQLELWELLSNLTLRLVYRLLGWFYSDIFYQPELSLVGTNSFLVEISYACSGIEGISLITLFFAIYLWLFRKKLRFPQVLWLFPLGIMAIWLANIVRITALVAIGTSFSPEVAREGFHAHAGWVAFILIAFGAMVLTHQLWFLRITEPGSPVVGNSGPSFAAALLVPMMVLIATSMVTAAFSANSETLYPLRVMAAAAVLWYYRKVYSKLGWGWSWQAAVIGVIVFLLWMLLEPKVDSDQTRLASSLAELPAGLLTIWLAFRVFGSVIIVPLAEELAFRGYLLRKLVASDFENVRLGQFTWFSFTVSSVLFGLLHGRWFAGTLAGMAYALVLSRRSQLGDAVLAHITTNALIAIWVLIQGRWALWS